MKILKAFPPNYAALAEHFPIKGRQGILYAWGDRLYNPSGIKLLPWLMAHEQTHMDRQLGHYLCHIAGYTPVENWWIRYVQNPKFRLNEEILAHRAEWQSFLQHTENKAQQQQYLNQIAARLSSPLYGSLLTLSEATREITSDNL